MQLLANQIMIHLTLKFHFFALSFPARVALLAGQMKFVL